MTTLETGAGASSIVFAAAGSAHTVISPAADEHERIRSWCERNGISTARVRFVAASSDTALAGSWTPEPLDLVLVDGAHLFPFPVLHATQHPAYGARLVVLDEAIGHAELGERIGARGLQEEAASVAVHVRLEEDRPVEVGV